MNILLIVNELDATTQRLNAYHQQIATWLTATPANDPATAERRALVADLKDRLNRARIAVGAVRVRKATARPLVAIDLGRRDVERMTQDLDRVVERMNTFDVQVDAWLKGAGQRDELRGPVEALYGRHRLALTAVRAARVAAQKVAPVDYRDTDLLMII